MMLILQILSVPVLLILPGYFFLRFVTGEKSLSSLLLSIPFSVPFTSVVAFALAEIGFFSLGSVTAVALLILFLLFLCRDRSGLSGGLLPRPVFCAVSFGLMVVAFFYFSPPFEYFFGGRDPGIYVVNGIRIAKTDGFKGTDPLVKSLPKEYRSLFFENHNPVRYMGFQLRGEDASGIVPNFFYLYPIWISLFFAIFGIHGMLLATPFLACCALWMILVFARSMMDEAGGVAAVLLLVFNAIYLWFARFPNSEFIASYFVFAGILGLHLYQENKSFAFGMFGSVCLALSFYARIDAVLMGVPFLLFFGIRWMEGAAEKRDVWLLLGYFLVLFFGVAHALRINPEYLTAAFYNLRFKPYKVALVLAGLAAIAGLLFYVGKRIRITERNWVGKIFLVGLFVVLLYAYFVRPYYPAVNIGSPNAGAFLALGWYFTHPVIVLALAGLILYSTRFRSINWIFFPAVLIYGTLYFYRIRADAEHFWMLRRYLMILCPAVALYSVYAVRWILQKIAGRRSGGAMLILAVGLACYFVYENRDLHRHHEFQGSFAFLETLAHKLNNEDLLLIGAKSANDLHIIGPMLSYYFDRNVLLLRSTSPDPELLGKFLGSWKGKVYFAGAGNSNLASESFSLKPVEQITFTTPTYDELYHQRPTKVLTKLFQIGWYRVELGPSSHPDSVDIGKYDDGSITNFHLTERHGNIDYRWTDGKGRVFFPPDAKPITKIVLRLNPGPWVPGMERVRVRLYVNNLYLVDLKLRNGYNTYEVPVPAGIREKLAGVPVEIRIESKSWVPKRVLNLPDTRRVGVIVDWVHLERGT